MTTCSVLVFDYSRAKAEGRVVQRACGAPSVYTITMGGDTLFAVCQRHNSRLARAGVEDRTHDPAPGAVNPKACICPCPPGGCPIEADGPGRQCEPCATYHPDGLPPGEEVLAVFTA